MYPHGMTSSGNPYAEDPVRYLHVTRKDFGDWLLWLHWVTTPDGRAVVARVVVEAETIKGTELGDRLPDAEVPAMTAAVFRSLPIGTFIADSREEAIGQLPMRDPDRRALAARAATDRDAHRRRAAEVVWQVRQTNRRSPYEEAALLLWREGITDPHGGSLKPRRLAKWIKAAETRGEYPPPNREENSK